MSHFFVNIYAEPINVLIKAHEKLHKKVGDTQPIFLQGYTNTIEGWKKFAKEVSNKNCYYLVDIGRERSKTYTVKVENFGPVHRKNQIYSVAIANIEMCRQPLSTFNTYEQALEFAGVYTATHKQATAISAGPIVVSEVTVGKGITIDVNIHHYLAFGGYNNV